MASRLPQARQEQPVKQTPFLHHHYDGWTIAVLAIGCLLPAIIIFGTLFGIEKNIDSFYFVQDIAAGIACVLGLLGMLLYIARVRHWPLPHALTLHGDGQETNVRLLAISLIATLLPVILIIAHHVIHR